MRCADGLVVSTPEERELLVERYDAVAERIEIIPPGVDHTVFTPGPTPPACGASGGSGATRCSSFVGRIQPLKGVDLAVQCPRRARPPAGARSWWSAARAAPTATPSWRASTRSCTSSALTDRVRFEPPRRARSTSPRYYRARRRRAGPVAHRVVRPGRARGRRVRHAGGRVGGRRPALRRRSRCERLPRRRPRSEAFAACVAEVLGDADHAADLREQAAPASPGATRGASPRRGCVASTPTSPPASSCGARQTSSTSAGRRAGARAAAPVTSKVRSRRSRGSSTSSTTRASRGGTCASGATVATRRRSTSTCTSARCATRCTSCPTRPRTTSSCYRFLLTLQPRPLRRPVLDRSRRRPVPGGAGRARAPRRGRSSTGSSACSTRRPSAGSSRWSGSRFAVQPTSEVSLQTI